jgi:hypothetical protein
MAVYIIKAVKYDEQDVPVEVIWHQVDAQANEWIGEEMKVGIDHVIAMLDQGYTVYLEWFVGGRSVMGPKVRKTVYPNGVPGIESAERERPFSELPWFD